MRLQSSISLSNLSMYWPIFSIGLATLSWQKHSSPRLFLENDGQMLPFDFSLSSLSQDENLATFRQGSLALFSTLFLNPKLCLDKLRQ